MMLHVSKSSKSNSNRQTYQRFIGKGCATHMWPFHVVKSKCSPLAWFPINSMTMVKFFHPCFSFLVPCQSHVILVPPASESHTLQTDHIVSIILVSLNISDTAKTPVASGCVCICTMSQLCDAILLVLDPQSPSGP
jgi:hypothetical protein